MPNERVILSLNCGSSSLKFSAYRMGAGNELRLLNGAAERIGLPDGRLWACNQAGAALIDQTRTFTTHGEVLDAGYPQRATLQSTTGSHH